MERQTRSPSSSARLVSEVVRLSAHTAWDRVRRPVPLAASDIPHCVEAITADWLTAVLCAGAPGVRVAAIDGGAVTAGSSVRRRLALTYAPADAALAAGLPASVFVKTSGRLLNRLMLGLSRTIEIEVQAYRHVRPQLDVEAPRCLHAGYDLRSGRQVVVLEDLVATKSARFGTPDMTVTRAQSEQMVDWLAALHRPFAGRDDLERAYPWLKTYPEWFRDGHERWGLRRYHDQALREAADVIPADVRRRGAEIWPAQVRSLAVHERERTVLHGDVHVGNWYVTGDGRMGLCDWQCLCIGNGLRDVAYALSTALSIDHRRAWERDLVRRYVDAVGGGATFDASWTLYRQQMIAALLMWTPTLCHSPIMPDMQPRAVCLALIGRIATAMSDLESLDAG